MEKKNQIPKYPHLRFPEFTDEWKEVKLGEVAHFSGGGTPSSEYSSYWEGTIPWISSSDIQNNNVTQINVTRFITKEALQHSSTKLCKAPCVLVVTRVGVGKVAYSDIDICTSQDFCILTDIQCEYHFLSYYLLTVMGKKVREVQGTSIKGITMQEVKSFHLCLPSLPEQRKIAALLSLIDERIEVQNAIIKEQEALKASLLRRLFDRTLRFPEFTDEWKVVKLGEVGKMYNGLSGKKAADFGAGYPFITYKMVFDSGVIDMSKVSYVEIRPGEKQNKVREGDIFFTTSSETIDEVGMSSVLLRDADNLFLNSFCFGYRLNTPNLTTSQYLGYMLRGPQMRMRISSLGQGITRFNISKEKVADLQIAIPSLPEQRKIAALLSLIDERIAVEKEYATLLQKQKAYLLRQMFV